MKVKAISINSIEINHALRSSMVDERKWDEFVMDVDVSGVLETVDEENSNGFKVGDRIVCPPWHVDGHGSFADYCICRTELTVKIPDSVPFELAAPTPVAGLTAYKSIMVKMRVQENCSVVITGGNGGLGGYGFQLVRMCGCNPIIATCSPCGNTRVMQVRATHCIDYRSEDVVCQISSFVGLDAVDYIMDGIDGDSAKSLCSTLALDGHIACVAGVMPRDKSESYFKGITVHEISLAPCAYLGKQRRASSWCEIGNSMMELLAEGNIDPMIGRSISLEEVATTMNT